VTFNQRLQLQLQPTRNKWTEQKKTC